MVRSLFITKDQVTKCMHHASVLGMRHCLYVLGTLRKIIYVAYFTFSDNFMANYAGDLEQCFWPKIS